MISDFCKNFHQQKLNYTLLMIDFFDIQEMTWQKKVCALKVRIKKKYTGVVNYNYGRYINGEW